VETPSVVANAGEVWIALRDGTMFGPRGEKLSRKAFEASSGLSAVVVLPHNERDDLERLRQDYKL
jgi:hypothetical protein